MRRAAVMATTALAALLAGCAKVPPVQRPSLETEVPDVWAAVPDAARAEEVADAWWEEFGDPRLSEAVVAALENNHDLRAAAARVAQAEAQARIAGADRKPAADVGLSGSRRKQSFIGLPVPGGDEVLSSTVTSYGASVNISWEIDLWGRLRATAGAAVADLQAAKAEFAAARLSLAGQTTKAWLAASEAAQQVDLARRTVETWRQSYEQVRHRYERGVRPSLDVRLAGSSLADAEALLALRLRQQDATVRQLEVLLGRYPGRNLHPPTALPAVPREIPGGLPADLVDRRPDLAAAERRLAAADQRLVAARRSLYPRISLTASGGTASTQLTDLVDGNFGIWSLAANLLQPLFQGGKLRAGVDRAAAGTDEALESYVAGALRAYAEVETALAADDHLAQQDDRLAESSRQATAARALALGRYQAGLEDYVTVLESQRRQFLSESALLNVRRVRLENRVDLYLALGGGFRRPRADPERPLAADVGVAVRAEPEP